MLTSKVREKIELPHEPGQWIEIRQLSAQHFQEARETRAETNLRAGRRFFEMLQMRKVAGLDDVPVAPVETPAETEPAPVIESDPLLDFDAFTLLKYGIVAWSYPEPVNVGNIADLDEETVDLIARRLTPRARNEEERKNGSTSSTKPSKVVEEPPTTG